jgi:hypothetical protein
MTEQLYDLTTVLVTVSIFCSATAVTVFMIAMSIYDIVLYKNDQKKRGK